MKPIFIIILCLFSIIASAQKIRFADSRNQWVTYGIDGDGCHFSSGLIYGSDTFAYQRTYKQLNVINLPVSNPGCLPISGAAIPMLIREDTTANIVYYRTGSYIGAPNNDTIEHILYDYALQVGDTIQYTINSYPVVDSVVSIDSIIINGVYHKVFTMNCRNTQRAYTFIEGIGSTVDPESPAFFIGCFEYGENLVCFTQDTLPPNITTPYYLCSIGLNDSFRNCATLSVNNIQKQPSSLTISPNPVSTTLTITADYINNIVISNLFGQLVYSEDYHTEKVQINISNLPSGVYFIKVNEVEIRKFIKQ